MICALDSVSKVSPQGHARVRALHEVSLRVTGAEHIALLGPSGAGKSTLFRLLNATIRPTHGAVFFEGHDLSAMTGTQIRAMHRADRRIQKRSEEHTSELQSPYDIVC